MHDDDLPFEGVTVLDLSQGVAGPYAGMLLARNGADVIKLEPPGTGDWSRALGKSQNGETAHSLIANRGKRSLALDLKHPEGAAIARELAATSHVIIQNFRVGKIDRFGLDYKTVAKTNPAVVYAAVTGFGGQGPRIHQPATDSVMQAYTGIMSINRDATGLPQRINMLAIDISTGLYIFQAIAAGLYRQVTRNKGALIETSLLESSLVFQEAALIESALQGEAVEPIGMPVGTFKTADGYMSINARRQNQFEAFVKLLSHPEWIDDPRFENPRARVENRDALMPLIRPIIETRTTAEWSADLEARDILHGPVHTHHDLFEDPQVNAVSALHWIEDRALGRVPMATLPGQPTPLTGAPLSQSPALGAHSREILEELGRSADEIDDLCTRGVIARPPQGH
jgi:crotonobetainyl-CoA:carnitine CoA-transferase CaiB-like acyl-CoA transferase